MSQHDLQRAQDFADPDDRALFPRLTEAEVAELATVAEQRSLAAGEALFEQGQSNTPFYVVESGAVDIFDQQPEERHYFAQCRAGTFIGDIAVFTGEPTIASGSAPEPTSLLEISPEALRTLVVRSPQLGDLILRTFVARREWLEGHGYGQVRLIGLRSSSNAFAVRELLERNLVPFDWRALEEDSPSQALLHGLGISESDGPVLIRNEAVLRRATVETVAVQLGLRATVDRENFDVVVVGGGPAGLACAVYAASEGLTTFVAERFAPGGQAGTSARIENYLGFPMGLSGAELSRRATLQARKFGTVISSVHEVSGLSAAGADGMREVVLSDGQIVRARYVVIASGVDYRRLEVENAERFEGAGLYYAATHMEALHTSGQDVVVVGGANSAGQAAVGLSKYACKVHLVARHALDQTMSQYLVDQVESASNIVVWAGYEIESLDGADTLQTVTIRNGKRVHPIAATAVFAMIGALPRTAWMTGVVGLDERGFVTTGDEARSHSDFSQHWSGNDRTPLLLETTQRDVFAAGDVRSGSTKRVAAAVGDGALAVQLIHHSRARTQRG